MLILDKWQLKYPTVKPRNDHANLNGSSNDSFNGGETSVSFDRKINSDNYNNKVHIHQQRVPY